MPPSTGKAPLVLALWAAALTQEHGHPLVTHCPHSRAAGHRVLVLAVPHGCPVPERAESRC